MSEEETKAKLNCPVIETPCPRGDEEALLCIERCMSGDYNPLLNVRDSAVLNCGVERAIVAEKKAN